MKILIVDDSKTMRRIVRSALEQMGYRGEDLKEAGNGEEALAVANAGVWFTVWPSSSRVLTPPSCPPCPPCAGVVHGAGPSVTAIDICVAVECLRTFVTASRAARYISVLSSSLKARDSSTVRETSMPAVSR